MFHQQESTLLSQTFHCFRVEFFDKLHTSLYAESWGQVRETTPVNALSLWPSREVHSQHGIRSESHCYCWREGLALRSPFRISPSSFWERLVPSRRPLLRNR
jgi:hypothetical protein